MPRFFTDNITGDRAVVEGPDAAHMAGPLRMKPGDRVTVCDLAGTDYTCAIESVDRSAAVLRVLDRAPSVSEPGVRLRLFQAMPKSDKLETIVQKATELGASEIVPVLTARCIARPDAKSMEKKLARLRKIALEAAKQAGRGRIPQIAPLTDFACAIETMAEDALGVFCYERAERPLRDFLAEPRDSVSVFVGSEGGFAPEEAARAAEAGLAVAGLGPRILRCETAPVAVLSAILYAWGAF